MKNGNKGMNKYEGVLKKICNVEDLHYLRGAEWEGCLGVAIVLAFMEGVPANIQAIARYLDVSPYNQSLGNAFNRLKVNAIFNKEYGTREDSFLKGEAVISPQPKFITPRHMSDLVWCQIAGIAGGFTGIKIEERKKVEEVEEAKEVEDVEGK